jgi:hypothetical protein
MMMQHYASRQGYVGLNPELAQIVSQVLGSLSPEAAAEQLEFRLSRTPIGDLRKGKAGREATVRTFGEGFWERICQHYGDQVREGYGDCNQETAADWFAVKAGFGSRTSQVPARVPETLLGGDLALEDVDVRAFRGTQNLTQNDIELINDLVRRLIREADARQRRDG